MSGPQVEDGFTRIANELLDAILCAGFSKRELTLLLAIIRKTYGFNKREDDMTFQQLERLTGVKRSHVSETVRDLAARRVVLIRDGTHGYVIGLNKNYRQWVSQNGTGNQVSQNGTKPCPKSGQKGVPKREPQKTLSKRQPQKTAGRSRATAVTLKRYLEDCKQEGVKPIPPEDPVFTYAEETGIPLDYLRLCWLEFVDRYREKDKRQKDWRQTFRNCVRGNWYRLWFIASDGSYGLTTVGKQAEAKHGREQ